ncbi:MAG: serine/threonine-protein phosphatase [Gammaproteobacteria bacterium]|nr:serine/threonine-protein phosphatase [Gammaproteobacteria bacterium]
MKYQLASLSIAGGRASNQDRVLCEEGANAVLLVLADGLGGHAGGAFAADILTRTAQHAFASVRQPVITKPSAFLALTILRAHKEIVAYGQSQKPAITPRTTCVLCLVQNGYAYWAHVGDSRLYHFRNGQVLRRTLDHTVTEQMHLEGLLTENEMMRHPEKSRLLKAVGGSRAPIITLGEETPLQRGDTLLLCSDGLWEALPAAEMAKFLSGNTLEENIEDMLFAAETRMQKKADNLSAICFRWEEGLTHALPLQTGDEGGGDVDPGTLLGTTPRPVASAKPVKNKGARNTKTAPPEPKKKSLDDTIDELEAFLARFEKH